MRFFENYDFGQWTLDSLALKAFLRPCTMLFYKPCMLPPTLPSLISAVNIQLLFHNIFS